MSVEFINWYWIYSANIWGIYVIWRVSVRPSGAGLGNISGQECTFSYMYTGQLPPGARFAGAQFAATKFPWGPICRQGAQSAGARFAGAQFAGAQFAAPKISGAQFAAPKIFRGPICRTQNFLGPNLPPWGPICRGPICRGPICQGPICRGPICQKMAIWAPKSAGPICRQFGEGPNLPGPNLPGPNLPRTVRGRQKSGSTSNLSDIVWCMSGGVNVYGLI